MYVKKCFIFFKYGKLEIIIFAVVRCLPELKMKVPVGAVNSLIKESADGALLILAEIFFLRTQTLQLIVHIIAIKAILFAGEKVKAQS